MLLSKPERRRIAVVNAQDDHTLEAVTKAAQDGMVHPVLIGDEQEIREILARLAFDAGSADIIKEGDPAACAQIAADMVRKGDVQCVMKGKIETGPLMKVLVNKENGIRQSDTMSFLAMAEAPNYHKIFGITDVGLLTYPTQEQKEAAIVNAVRAFHALGIAHPKVAILAAVEKVNLKMPDTVEADAIKQKGINGCIIEGPISYDLAMDPESAPIKGYSSPVAGDADLLVVPDIVCGNIAIKTISTVAGGRACGVVLGAMVPIVVMSRSTTADDKYMSIVLSALVGGN